MWDEDRGIILSCGLPGSLKELKCVYHRLQLPEVCDRDSIFAGLYYRRYILEVCQIFKHRSHHALNTRLSNSPSSKQAGAIPFQKRQPSTTSPQFKPLSRYTLLSNLKAVLNLVESSFPCQSCSRRRERIGFQRERSVRAGPREKSIWLRSKGDEASSMRIAGGCCDFRGHVLFKAYFRGYHAVHFIVPGCPTQNKVYESRKAGLHHLQRAHSRQHDRHPPMNLH